MKTDYLKTVSGKFVVSVLVIGMAGSSFAQNIQRQLLSAKEVHRAGRSHLEIVTNDGRYTITPYSDQMVETSFFPNGEKLSEFEQSSHAVVQTPGQVRMRLQKKADGFDYVSAGMRVHVQAAPFQISYFYQGKLLTSEKQGYEKLAGAANDFALSFNLDAAEALYGAGARALGMNRRGHRLPLYNKAHYGYEERSEQMNFAIPLVYSSKLYGIHFDNAAIGTLDLDSEKQRQLRYESVSGRKTYQVFAATSWPRLIANYTQLTGRQPLPPRWAFGNFASRFGYHNEAEARSVVGQFRAEQIPLDAIIFDLYWFGKDIKGTMGNLAFDADQFKSPQKMIADFKQQNVKTILITEPFILSTSKRWQEALQKNVLAKNADGSVATYDFYFGNTGLIDLFQPKARDWFWSIYRGLVKQGVAGVWGDLGEPEVHPSSVRHADGKLGADQVHNIYGHEWAKLVAQGYQKEFPQQRPFILMRAGYSGSQRFGLIPWSGDVNRTWGGLRSQPEIALQMSMQGLAYMHSDLGGFAGANLDDELYTRWLQYGVFQPVFRPHAQEEVAAEPIFRDAATKALAKQAIELRYRMLPYNYTLAFDNQEQGLPLMRPLFFEEADRPEWTAHAASYLWGQDFLVHPVMQAGQQQMQINFPRTSVWFDFYSDQSYAAGSAHTLDLSLQHLPVFVRAGAFVPMAQPMQSTAQFDAHHIDLHYYHDASVREGRGQMYEDDGATPDAYRKGQYRLFHFASQFDANNQTLALNLKEQRGRSMDKANTQFDVTVHNIAKAPLSVMRGQKKLEFVWDAATKQLRFAVANAGQVAVRFRD
ncbi:MAG: DUF5110 domain-containing protein [Burkholderiales bacterium]|nr:DUF5110 domain-containing protein [Burkholderiales bacterium]